MLRIFLNNILCQDKVEGLDSITEDLELKTELHGYLYQVEGSIIFSGVEYEYLRGLFESEHCQDVTVDIQQSLDFGGLWTTKIKGLIKLSGVRWNRILRTAECPIVDNSYQAKINNNRQIVFQLGDHSGTVLSKNGVDVSSKVVFHNDVYLFSPFRGRYFFGEALYNKSNPPFDASEGNDLVNLQPQARIGMFIWDALNLLIAMMTDNEVDFVSDYFSYDISDLSTARDEAVAMIFSGGHLRHGSTYPKLNYEQFFNDLHKLNNVWFAMEYTSAGKPCIRIEHEDYFRQANSGVYFNSVKSFVEAIDLGKVYSKVVVGCSVSSNTNFPVGSIPLVNHVQEEFPLTGTCNVSNELNLRLEKLIISTNAIAEALPPIVGFSNGGSVKRKFTNETATAEPNQQLTDSAAEFKTNLIQQKMLIENTVTGEWSYITGVPSETDILIWDEIFTPSGTGPTKDYEIYKPSEDTQFKDEVFLIQISKELGPFDSLLALQTEIDPPSGLYYYNETFANYKVIERHMGGVAQSIVSSLSDGNDEFLAQQSSNHILNDTAYFQAVPNGQYRRVRFDDDVNSPNFDTNNNYDPLTGIYTGTQGGYYHAYCSVRFVNGHTGGEDFIQQVELCRVSATGDVLEAEASLTTITEPGSFTFTMDRTFYLAEGETIQVFVKKPFGTTGIWLNQYIPFSEFNGLGSFGEGYGIISATDLTFFGVDFLYNGGGLVPASDPEDVRLLNFETELSVSRETFDSVLANPFKRYHTNLAPTTTSPHYQTGYIGKISRGILDGECTMTQFKKMDGV